MDKTMKHTPGPWNVDSFADGDLNLIYGSDGEFVTDCNANPNRGSDHGERAQANARLIAAVPELLAYAECEEAHNVSRLPTNRGGSGNGQSYLEVFTKHGFRKNDQYFGETVYQFLDRLRRTAIAKATGA